MLSFKLNNVNQMNPLLVLLVAADLDDLAAVATLHRGRYSAGSMLAAVVVEGAEHPKYLGRKLSIG